MTIRQMMKIVEGGGKVDEFLDAPVLVDDNSSHGFYRRVSGFEMGEPYRYVLLKMAAEKYDEKNP